LSQYPKSDFQALVIAATVPDVGHAVDAAKLGEHEESMRLHFAILIAIQISVY
jgi:hypothetical protein